MNSNLIEICMTLMTDEFRCLKTSNEKVKYFLNKTEIFERFLNYFINTIEEYIENYQKSLSTGMAYLDEGNDHYNQRQYELAINSFSNAIMTLPVLTDSGSYDISLAYSLRSNAYYKLKSYSSALSDANCALKLVETVGMKVRKIHCFIHLDRYSEAKEVIDELVQSQSHSEGDQSVINHLKTLRQCVSDSCFDERDANVYN